MRQARPVRALALSCLLLTGCERAAVERVNVANDDLPRPDDFEIRLELGTGERVDTRSGLVTKDMISLPDTTIELRFTPAQLDTLHQAVARLGILDLPEPHPAQDMGSGMDPNTTINLYVRAGGRTRSLAWSTEYRPHPRAKAEWDRVHGLVSLLRAVVEQDSTYQSLPPSEGLYL